MAALVSFDALAVGQSVELVTQRGERVVATGQAPPAAGGNTHSASGDNAAPVAVADTATDVVTAAVTVAAGQVVIAHAAITVSNISEGGTQASSITAQITDDAAGSSALMQDDWASGQSGAALAVPWRRAGLSAGTHTFTLVATSSAGSGNSQCNAHQGVLVLEVLEG